MVGVEEELALPACCALGGGVVFRPEAELLLPPSTMFDFVAVVEGFAFFGGSAAEGVFGDPLLSLPLLDPGFFPVPITFAIVSTSGGRRKSKAPSSLRA